MLLAAAAGGVGALLVVFQPLASLMRNHKELRYLITPANLLWSLAAVGAAQAQGAAAPRQAIGLDAALGPALRRRRARCWWCWWSARRRAPPTGA